MRLIPGTSLDHADSVLRQAESKWGDARNSRAMYRAYLDAVAETHHALKKVFVEPDIGSEMRSAAYWALLSIGTTERTVYTADPDIAANMSRVTQMQNIACASEIEHQVSALQHARSELESLKKLAARPGLPVVYDTNMLNHWKQPGDIRWREVFKANGEDVPLARLVVPLRVIDELDGQKYGGGDLGKRSTAAIRYLERTLKGSRRGEPVTVRPEATLEVWTDAADRSEDADLSILRCAADVANLHSHGDVRVLTGDLGMRLRAQQMDLEVLQLPEEYRKPHQGSSSPCQPQQGAVAPPPTSRNQPTPP
jgi:hypothetical protein